MNRKNKIKLAISKGRKNVKINRKAVTIYVPVSHHIYHDGNSYRVRVAIDGVKHSKSFESKAKAYKFRKKLLNK